MPASGMDRRQRGCFGAGWRWRELAISRQVFPKPGPTLLPCMRWCGMAWGGMSRHATSLRGPGWVDVVTLQRLCCLCTDRGSWAGRAWAVVSSLQVT